MPLSQIQELVQYLARTEPEESRSQFLKPFQDVLATSEDQTPLADDENRRKEIIKLVVAQIHGLGDGNERGAYYFTYIFLEPAC